MRSKKDLFEELNIKGEDNLLNPFYIDAEKIKIMVNNSIDSAYSERKKNTMKSKKKFLIVAAAAAFVLGITAMAASSIITSWVSHSSSIPEFTSLPTKEQCIEEIGYAPMLIDEFSNGYKFANASVKTNILAGRGEEVVDEFKSMVFRYEKDGDVVSIFQDKVSVEMDAEGELVRTVGKVPVYYTGYKNKNVPSDYVMTDEDKEAEKNGELVFSYGSSKVEIIDVESVFFEKAGVQYRLIQIDGCLGKDGLLNIAEEMINE